MALFESFGDTAERLTARVCFLLIGARGPHLIERYYRARDRPASQLIAADLERVSEQILQDGVKS